MAATRSFLLRSARLLGVCLAACVAVAPAVAQLEHRKTDLTVKVKNLNGAALPGATVKVEMLNHAFRWGAAVEAWEVYPGDSRYNAKAAEMLQRYFNSTTFGNQMKWTEFENRARSLTLAYVQAVQALKPFNASDSFRLRGHATIWGAQYVVPTDVRPMTDPEAIRTRMLNHIFTYHDYFKDKNVDNFDLYNEPFHERTYFINKLVPGGTIAQEGAEIAKWFKKAREADPNAKLFINEYNILNFWQENDSDVIKYKQLIDAIRDAGGPVDGVGEQAHMDRMITKAQIKRRIDILTAPMAPTANYPQGLPGLPFEVTELDVNVSGWNPTPAQQAQVVANVLEATFEHPMAQGVTIWGMNDSTHWRSNAVMFDDRTTPGTWAIKPSGQAYIDRVMGTWWTNLTGISGATGEYVASAFKGRHKITVEYQGQTQEFIRDLTNPTELPVIFETEPVNVANSKLTNMSVRSRLDANEELTIGFHVANGSTPILVRAAGPALTPYFGAEAMADPKFSLFDVNTAGQPVAAGANDNWDAALAGTFGSLGAFPFEGGSKDAALVATLGGSNTAIVSGPQAGYSLVEAYDNSAADSPARLINISARKRVGTGNDILIAGFVVGGTGHKRLLVRGVGPKLGEYGVPNTLPNPQIQIHRVVNGVGTLVAENKDWASSLAPVFDQSYAFQLTPGSKDAALVVLVEAGYNYTASVSSETSETGVAMVEVYVLPY